ncbi:hypothetical protein MNEG_11051 [Monoraphidium neglectum]|uniref:Uncharacterized protein n=1 Tax=Monoraphidium neglectum TaxID=145388 RepID=A0A0D2KMF7_9CHLO|nr:hypothetical protein MNEG_11051 [Monoraphidium neglectum]KIY96908.1 hypothetical protein MNEG_11051 [Monoraphidium neglectum]|eukprot:XP_013895928.1 hypothetical protein MNEG_11051 [Monoraphidium neglectum]
MRATLWRKEYESTNRRPSAHDIIRWYDAHSDEAWGDDKPTVMETRVHAKCLRSVASVRNYFREYRAKKKHEQGRQRG